MRTFLRHIIFSTVLAIMFCCDISAQTIQYDQVLDRYESICERCLELRERLSAGEAVPQKTLVSLMEELGKLRSSLQETSGKMTPAQLSRFEAIKRRYPIVRTGELAKPSETAMSPEPVVDLATAVDDRRQANSKNVVKETSVKATTTTEIVAPQPEIPSEVKPEVKVSRDTLRIPFLAAPMRYCILQNPVNKIEHFDFEYQPAPELAGSMGNSPKLRFGILGSISAGTDMAYGATLLCTYGRLGVWAAGRSSFSTLTWNGTVSSSGAIEGGGKFWGDGTSQTGEKMALAGPLFNVTDYLSVYAAAGYGRYDVTWRSLDGTDYHVSDLSNSSPAFETGLLLHLRRFTFSAGICHLATYCATFGIGVNL